MSQTILIIGGTRFFGRLLVRDLLSRGAAVTIATRGIADDDFGDAVRRIRVDRRDRSAMLAAFEDKPRFDIVYDQMCYTPNDAAISAEVFAGKTVRYIMSSTIEVYAHLKPGEAAFQERDLDLSMETLEFDYPWHDAALPERYGEGKRQAEAVLLGSALPVATVRIGHVLGGPEDFTGRLAHYVAALTRNAPAAFSRSAGRSSFIDPVGITQFLVWAGQQQFLGPVNASDDGPLSAADLFKTAAAAMGRPIDLRPVPDSDERSKLSPFDYPEDFLMDTSRAKSLGFTFGDTAQWLEGQVTSHLPSAPAA